MLFLLLLQFAHGSHEDICLFIDPGYEELCNYTFGCTFNADAGCVEQDYFVEGAGSCSDAEAAGQYPQEIHDLYVCDYDSATDSYAIYSEYYFDYCSYENYYDDSDICNPIYCYQLEINSAGGQGCFTDSSKYQDMTNASICGTPKTRQGCVALPWCKWNASAVDGTRCQPDYDCYYYVLNGFGACPSGSKCHVDSNTSSVTSGFCTSDSVTSEQRKCNAKISSADPSEAACTAGGECEYIAAGTGTFGDYTAWCVPGGSGASRLSVSSFALAILMFATLVF